MLSHAASMASIELICINTRLGQRELTHTLTDIPATAVFTEGLFISRLLTPLVECPHVRLLIYDTSSEVDTDLEAINCEIDSLKVGLEGRVKIISIEELCKTGIEVMEIPELEKPKDKGRIWGHIYARALNEYVMPSADPVTNSQVAAGCKSPPACYLQSQLLTL